MTRFSTDRIFFVGNPISHRSGWYAQMREGVVGPFVSKKKAVDGLEGGIYAMRKNREEVWG